MIKYIFPLLFIQILTTCNGRIDKIEGTYSHCGYRKIENGSDTIYADYYLCSKVIFNKDNTGQFIPPSKLIHKFNWQVTNDTIKIFNNDEFLSKDSIFRFRQNQNVLDLQPLNLSNYTYNLRKTK